MRIQSFVPLFACIVSFMLLSASGCTKDDGKTPAGADLAMMIDSGAEEVVDMARIAPDGGGGDLPMCTSLSIRWNLVDCDLQGMQCGFAATCGEAGATRLTFTALNPQTKKSTVTPNVACPKDANSGSATICLPDAMGPFEIFGVIDGLKTSAGRHVCNVDPMASINATLYFKGCDDPRCSSCP